MEPLHKPLRVLVVDDNPVLRDRFSLAIGHDASLVLVDAVGTGAQAQQCITKHSPDVLLVDLGLPDMHGTEVIRFALCHSADIDCLVVTMFGDETNVMASIEAGATGYLLKDASDAEICKCIRDVHAGGSPISPAVARRVLSRVRNSVAVATPMLKEVQQTGSESMITPLSPRETEVLQLVAKGLSFEETGKVLGISHSTVQTHVKRLYRKLAVHSRTEAVYEARHQGIL